MNRLILLLLSIGLLATGAAKAADAPDVKLEQTVIKMPLEDGVSMDDAVDSMKLRANIHNMGLVAELPLSKQVEAMGRDARRMDIFQFCDPLTAQRMVEENINFAAYLPCRIALVEDENGQGWLVMMNLDMMLQSTTLSDELKAEATRVRDALMEIMQAGAEGAL
ncbi:DUF302 domain-containing protein [Thiohalophilus thiocyanatoxydans]|uniref:Uncharacterized protein (DUF302 family) n=1 Tax=Thiohalophilus thiocyanatoxydans TaxID=381308 RepID=A0A4R8IEU9_9GAMM|nr:DUF302 domain-containing protein [Thiohalophilus thiocyanatoxydans]TDX98129.1 uncharacterized protein (DUF302 family) [Thiohalophilus thiocyanatoxydans]